MAGLRPALIGFRPAPWASANALAQWAGLTQLLGLPEGQAQYLGYPAHSANALWAGLVFIFWLRAGAKHLPLDWLRAGASHLPLD